MLCSSVLLFPSRPSGIMGLFGDTLFSELVAAGQYAQNVFGMCLFATEGQASNGTINFGGVDTSLYTGEIQWTQNTDGQEFYVRSTAHPSIHQEQLTRVNCVNDAALGVSEIPPSAAVLHTRADLPMLALLVCLSRRSTW